MLSPDERLKLLESLAPPAGHTLSLAVGTSYSLNLEALLVAPAAFALFRTAADGTMLVPVEIIDSIQRHADRITLFHQAGQISVPKTRLLFGLIEAMVVPACAPLGGIFHPKVWVLRYRDEAHGHVRYRLLCSSRNLTHDASWDTLLRLDSDSSAEHATTLPGLAGFIRALPNMALGRFDDARRGQIEALASELDEVRFALPPGFDHMRFHGLGLAKGERDPLPRDAQSLLVVSPFLGLRKVRDLASRAERSVLVSRAEEIERLGRGLDDFTEVLALDPDAHPSLAADAEIAAGPAGQARRTFDDPECSLLGLHAKLYVFDAGERTRLFTGSANAGEAAFSSNVEALVELQGPSRKVGVKVILGEGEDEAPSLRSLLYEPRRSVHEPDPDDDLAESLDRLRREIAKLVLRGEVEPVAETDRYAVHYRSDEPVTSLRGATLKVRPVTLGDAHAVTIQEGVPLDIRFELSFESLSRFIACELAQDEVATQFVLCADLVGLPEDRRVRLVAALLKDSTRVLRYLLILLMDRPEDRWDAQAILAALEPKGASKERHGRPAAPLLEALLRTLHREPARLRMLHEFVQSLATHEQTATLLPEGFGEIWDPIWALAQEMDQ